MKNKLIQVKGRHLVKGTQYFLDMAGSCKAIYEGTITSLDGQVRHLFTPTQHNIYLLYGEDDYDGEYVGKFSIWDKGYFYQCID